MITKSIRMPSNLLEAITVIEKEEKIEETTANLKLIKIGYETSVGDLHKAGRLSREEISRYLGINQIDALELLRSRSVKGNLDTAGITLSLEKFAKA
jgi:hypothetical protein